MDVRQIFGPATDHWVPVSAPVVAAPAPPRAAAAAAAANVPRPEWSAPVADTATTGWQALKDTGFPPDGVRVAVHRRSDGVQLVTLYDPQTGNVIAQMPPENLITAIDAALRARQEGKSS